MALILDDKIQGRIDQVSQRLELDTQYVPPPLTFFYSTDAPLPAVNLSRPSDMLPWTSGRLSSPPLRALWSTSLLLRVRVIELIWAWAWAELCHLLGPSLCRYFVSLLDPQIYASQRGSSSVAPARPRWLMSHPAPVQTSVSASAPLTLPQLRALAPLLLFGLLVVLILITRPGPTHQECGNLPAMDKGRRTRGIQALRVGSFNIRYDGNSRRPVPIGEGAGEREGPPFQGGIVNGSGEQPWSTRRSYLTDQLLWADLDIMGLQEVLVNQLHDISQLVGDSYGYVGVGRDDGKEAGEYVPVFYRKSRLEVISVEHFWLSLTPEVPGSKSWDAVRCFVPSQETGSTEGTRLSGPNSHGHSCPLCRPRLSSCPCLPIPGCQRVAISSKVELLCCEHALG